MGAYEMEMDTYEMGAYEMEIETYEMEIETYFFILYIILYT